MRPGTRTIKFLYLGAALVFLTTLGIWLGTGAHVGWTKTTVTDWQLDEVTGIEGPVVRDHFVAGVEILALGLGLTGALALAGVLARRLRTKP